MLARAANPADPTGRDGGSGLGADQRRVGQPQRGDRPAARPDPDPTAGAGRPNPSRPRAAAGGGTTPPSCRPGLDTRSGRSPDQEPRPGRPGPSAGCVKDSHASRRQRRPRRRLPRYGGATTSRSPRGVRAVSIRASRYASAHTDAAVDPSKTSIEYHALTVFQRSAESGRTAPLRRRNLGPSGPPPPAARAMGARAPSRGPTSRSPSPGGRARRLAGATQVICPGSAGDSLTG